MLKLVGLFKKKPGMTRGEFIQYYETRHVPLAAKLLALGHDYRRSYIKTARVQGRDIGPQEEFEFDVVTEVWFRDQAAYDTFCKSVCDPDVWPQIVADELNFFDRSASRVFLTEEHVSTLA